MRILISLFVVVAITAAIAFWPAPAPVAHPYLDAMPTARAEIIAHGGGQGVRPTNTLIALDTAAAMGADVLEIDVQMTGDGVPIVLHDATLDRTTDLSGSVATMTLVEVRRADAGANDLVEGADFSGQGIGVPTLEEAFSRHPAARWVLEIKTDTDEAAVAMCDAIHAAGATNRVLVGSFHDHALQAFRATCPEVATSTAKNETRMFAIAALLGVSRFVPTPAVALQIPEAAGGLTLAQPRIINAAHQRGIVVQIWTVNDPADMERLLALGVDGVITDYVEVLRGVIETQ